MLKVIRYFWQLILRAIGFGPKPWTAEQVDDPPENPTQERVYIVGENGAHWCVIFICPCGCGETINLNLLPQTRPRWTVQVDAEKKVTLSPSVWRKVGCKSHFYLRGSVVQWCGTQNNADHT